MNEPNTVWIPTFKVVGNQVFKVNITLALDNPVVPDDLTKMLESLAANGYMANEPGLNEGEEKMNCKRAILTSKANDDGTETKVVNWYPDKWRWTAHYINDEADESAFYAATGINISDMSEFPGAAPEYGKSVKVDAYFQEFADPIVVVARKNEKYVSKEVDPTSMTPKRYFDHYGNGSVPAPADAPPWDTTPPAKGNAQPKSAPQTGAGWKLAVLSDPQLVTAFGGDVAALRRYVEGLENLDLIPLNITPADAVAMVRKFKANDTPM